MNRYTLQMCLWFIGFCETAVSDRFLGLLYSIYNLHLQYVSTYMLVNHVMTQSALYTYEEASAPSFTYDNVS